MVNIDPDLLNNAFIFFVAYYKEYRKGVDTDIEYFSSSTKNMKNTKITQRNLSRLQKN